MARLRIFLLGPFHVTLDSEPVTDFITDKVRALLAYLIVESHNSHRRESLAGLLWADQSERAARANLRRALANLRQVIGDNQAEPPFLLITRKTIQFNRESDYWLDVDKFKGDLSTEQLKDINLYRGNFLEGFSIDDSVAFEEWALLIRERLNRWMASALYNTASSFEQGMEFEQGLPYARLLVEMEPLQENAQRLLMRLLVSSGQRNAALNQYRILKETLLKELQIDPDPVTRQLYEQIREGEIPGIEEDKKVFPKRERRIVGECPYRGLSSFREIDSPFFYGRERFTTRLRKAVKEQPFVTVIIGSSGSGKSSAVFAGLIPQLREEKDWMILHFRPGERPFHSMAFALIPSLEPELTETERLAETSKLVVSLTMGEISLLDIVERLLTKNQHTNRMLLVVDQFEELFTLCSDEAVERSFLDGLLEAVNAGHQFDSPSLVLLLTMRADFMSHALTYRPFANALQNATLLMGPMSRDELHLAIEKPAITQGAAFEPGLVERMLDDVGEEPGNLPLLEFALTLLWELQNDGWLTHSGYEEIGRVEGALARYADDVFTDLSSESKELAKRVFVQLVQPGEGTEDTRRTAYRSELDEKDWRMVHHLADKRLVVTGRDVDERETAEVAHEALIQRWELLQDWVEEARSFRIWQEELRSAMRTWEASDRDEGGLLRGVPLVTGESWMADRGKELSDSEKEFIRISVEQRERINKEHEQRRRRTILALAAGFVVALLLALFAFNAQKLAQREANINQSLVMASEAQNAFENGDGDLALALALESVGIDQPPLVTLRILSSIAMGPGTRMVLEGHHNPVMSVAISPDSLIAMSGSCSELAAGDECLIGEIILWDLQTGNEIKRFTGHKDWVTGLAFNPNISAGDVELAAISGSRDGVIVLWDINTGEQIHRIENQSGTQDIVFSPDGKTLLTISKDSTLILWNINSGDVSQEFKGHSNEVTCAAYSPDGQTILSGSEDRSLILWDVETGEPIKQIIGHDNGVIDLAFNPDGQTAMSIGNDQTLRMWDLETGEQLNEIFFGGGPGALIINPSGKEAVLTGGNFLRKWDIMKWQETWRLQGHSGGVNALVFNHDGRFLLSGSNDGTLRFWNYKEQIDFRHFDTDGDKLTAVDISKDGRHILTGGFSGDALLWDAVSGKLLHRFSGDGFPIHPGEVAFSPDGKFALVGAGDAFTGTDAKSLVLWDVETGEEIRRFEGHQTLLRSVAFSPDGLQALTGSQRVHGEGDSGDLILWDIKTGGVIRRFDTTEDVTSINFTEDGNHALTSSAYFANATIWDVSTGQAIYRFEGHTDVVLTASFGPDERTAISGGADGSLLLWDIETGEIIRQYIGHENSIWTLDVSPDGRYIASSGDDATIILWDFETGEELRRFSEHTGTVLDVNFSPDGQSVYSVGLSGELIQWEITDYPLDELVEWVKTNRYIRDLTCEERERYRVKPLCDE